MLEKVKGISVQGRCFEDIANLEFYPNEKDRIAIIYGKNGSGKSTISEGILASNLQNDVSDISVSFLSNDQEMPSITSVSVFNECYIDKNVKIEEDALGTIILLGGRVDLEDEINKKKKDREDIKNDLALKKADLDQCGDKKNPLSPLYHMERIKKILKQPSGWAEIDSKIKGSRVNSSVTDAVINEISTMSTELSIPELKKKLDETRNLLNKIQTTEKYMNKIKQINHEVEKEELICKVLEKLIKKPVLTEREKLIILAIEQGQQVNVEEARAKFVDNQVKHCPYCFQLVTDEYKSDLIASIDQVLNKDVDEHKTELNEIVFPQLVDDYEQYITLDSELVNKILNQLEICKTIIEQYKGYIKEKTNNIYTIIDISRLGLSENIEQLNVLLYKLEEKRRQFNEASSKIESTKKQLININKLIAHHQIAQNLDDYNNQLHEHRLRKNTYDDKNNAYKKICDEILQLEAEKSSIGLAIGAINNALDYVFFTKGRLSIELRNNKYYLKSKGHDVKPKKISLGERNIIALCYFFTQIMENQEVVQAYQNEKMVIIDDPISSFDFENKVGIMSFLRYQINRIIRANSQSKLLILSHDLVTVFDLRKAVDEICVATKKDAGVGHTTYSVFELVDNGLNAFKNKRSEYSELLQIIYVYAKSSGDEGNITIGNTMRRALEAFSTFNYRTSIQDVSCDANVLKTLGDHSSYFENLMYRLVLHNESHYEEQIYNLHDNANFYNYISESEKRRTARDVLCFMFFINPDHIKAHLKNVSNAIKDIEGWAKSIPSNATFEIKETQLEEMKPRVIKLYDLPLSAGLGNSILEDNVPYKDYETDNEKCDFALKIRGNSMEPIIKDGNIVLIKECNMLEEGQIGAFYHNGEVYCKRIQHNEKNTYMVSINSDYPDIMIDEDDNFKVYGKVVEIK